MYLNNFKLLFFNDFYSIIFFVMILWSGILFFFLPVDITTARIELIRMSGVYVCILLSGELLFFRKHDFTIVFLRSFVYAFYIVVALLLSGNSEIDITSGTYIYRGRFDLNANAYSYFSFFANLSIFYLIELKKKNGYIILSLCTIVLSIYVSFITSSRSGLMFNLLISVVYWLFIFNSKLMNVMIRYVLIGMVTLYSIVNVVDFYNNSYLKYRVDESVKFGDARGSLVVDAFNIFRNNAFTGVGPGQYAIHSVRKGAFSHNSFTEAAANLGIVGIILLFILLIRPLLESLRMVFERGYHSSNRLLKLNMLFFLTFILYNNFYVFYLTTFGMIFFVIVLSIQKKIKYGNNLSF